MSEQIKTTYRERDIIFREDIEKWECEVIGVRSESLARVKDLMDSNLNAERYNPPVPVFFYHGNSFMGGEATLEEDEGLWIKHPGGTLFYKLHSVFSMTDKNAELINRINEKTKLIVATETRRSQLMEELERFDPKVKS